MIRSNRNKPSIVLVHGAFADGSGWKKVISILEDEEFTVTAVQKSTQIVGGRCRHN